MFKKKSCNTCGFDATNATGSEGQIYFRSLNQTLFLEIIKPFELFYYKLLFYLMFYSLIFFCLKFEMHLDSETKGINSSSDLTNRNNLKFYLKVKRKGKEKRSVHYCIRRKWKHFFLYVRWNPKWIYFWNKFDFPFTLYKMKCLHIYMSRL